MPISSFPKSHQMKDCPRFNNCNANICPLDEHIERRAWLLGEKICPFILTYLDSHSTQKLEFVEEIKKTEHIWQQKHGEKLLASRIKSRKNMRNYFQSGINTKK